MSHTPLKASRASKNKMPFGHVLVLRLVRAWPQEGIGAQTKGKAVLRIWTSGMNRPEMPSVLHQSDPEVSFS